MKNNTTQANAKKQPPTEDNAIKKDSIEAVTINKGVPKETFKKKKLPIPPTSKSAQPPATASERIKATLEFQGLPDKPKSSLHFQHTAQQTSQPKSSNQTQTPSSNVKIKRGGF